MSPDFNEVHAGIYRGARELTAYIYALSDPRSGFIRYVGKTFNIGSRFRNHLSEKGEARKHRWIRSLLSAGARPALEVLEEIPAKNDEEWASAERWWIAYLRFIGCSLTNLDSGGSEGKRQAIETRAKIGAANKGKIRTAETIQKLRLAKLGTTLSAAAREKLSRFNKGKTLTAEHCAKISMAQLGRRFTEDHKAKIRAAFKNRNPDSFGTRNKGKRHSLETRRQMSESHRRRLQHGSDFAGELFS